MLVIFRKTRIRLTSYLELQYGEPIAPPSILVCFESKNRTGGTGYGHLLLGDLQLNLEFDTMRPGPLLTSTNSFHVFQYGVLTV